MKEQQGSVTLTAKLNLGEGAKLNTEAPSPPEADRSDWTFQA